MLTGQRLFTGKTVSHVLGAVLQVEPTWDALPTATPAPLRRLLRRCLNKDQKRRLRDVGEAVVHVEEAAGTPTGERSGAAAVASSPARRRQAISLVAALAVGSVITGLAVWSVMRPGLTEPRAITRFPIALSDPVSRPGRHALALSPDGRHLVYNSGGQLHLRAMDELQAVPIRGTEGAGDPFFSPDGQWIGFSQGAQLKIVSLSGGAAVTLCDAGRISGTSWGEDDVILYGQREEGIWRVPATGGIPELVIAVEDGEQAASPQRLPDSEWVLFTLRTGGSSWQIVAHSLETGDRRVLIDGGKDARFASTGHVVYGLEDTVLAQAFDPDRLMLVGGPVPLLEGVMQRPGTAAVQFSFSNSGSLVFLPGGGRVEHSGLGEPRRR